MSFFISMSFFIQRSLEFAFKAYPGKKICGLTLDCAHDIEILYLKSQRTYHISGWTLLNTIEKSKMITDKTFFTNEPGYALLDQFIKLWENGVKENGVKSAFGKWGQVCR